MLHSESFASSPEIQQLISVLTTSDPVGAEQRKQTREVVVCPVTVQFQYDLIKHKAFSRDFSSGGICLISPNKVDVEQLATLTIYRLNDVAMRVRARCIWSKPFGGDYTMSGWKFLRKVLQGDR